MSKGLSLPGAHALDALIQHSLDIIVILAPDGTFRYMSPSAERILGRPAASFVGQDPLALIHPDDQPASREALAWALAHPGQPATSRHRSLHADGHWVSLESKAINLLHDPLIGGVVIYTRDITEREEHERVLESAHRELEQQVRLRTAEVRRQHQALLELTLDRTLRQQNLIPSYRRILEVGAEVLKVEQVSLWRYSPDRTLIHCLNRFSATSRLHALGETLDATPHHQYLALLDSQRVSAFDDVAANPRTLTHLESYFQPHGVGAALVAHISIDGRCVGYVMFEHLGGTRHWQLDEQHFASSLADLAGAAIITHRHSRTEQALRQSEARFRALFEESTLGIGLAGSDGRIFNANHAYQAISGYTLSELKGMHIRELTLPEDSAREMPLVEECLAGQRNSYQLQKRLIRKDGSLPWIHLTLTLVNPGEGEPPFFLGIMEDITSQREAQERMLVYQEQLRALTAELSKVEERERQRIAGDLHDRIGQSLALIKMRLAELSEAQQGERESDCFRQVCGLLDQAIVDTRSLIFELSPPVLHLLGFEAALAWLAEHTSAQHGLKVRLRSDHQDKPLDEETQGVLFRSVREILFNVVKHARARQALIDVHRQGGWIVVTVEDDGVGFPALMTARSKWPQGGFGLFHVRERLSQAGGRLEIHPAAAGGTAIRLYLPLDREHAVTEVTDDAPTDAGR